MPTLDLSLNVAWQLLPFFLNKILFIFKIYFVIFWLCWVFIAVRAFSSCGEWGLLSSGSVKAFHCTGFSCGRAWTLGSWLQ